MSLELRRATAADEPALRVMAAEVVEAGEMFVFTTVEEVLGYWLDPGGDLWVAAEDGEVLGTFVVKPNQPGRGSHVANAGYMTLAAARGSGVGRAMGERSLEVARAAGFAAMQFNMVVSSNEDAVHLWRELGFDVVGTLPAVFERSDGARVDAYVMHRLL